VLECVVNISEGRRLDVIETAARAGGVDVLDVHVDPDHHRSVITLIGDASARAVAAAAVSSIGLAGHDGVHPRIGAVDVVPFVPLGSATMDDALAARDHFAAWAGDQLGVPCFLYGPDRTLPQVRAGAFIDFGPDTGPNQPHPTAGAVAVGARPVLVAYNLWLRRPDLTLARSIAHDLRGPAVRALGLAVGPYVQVSMNLVDPDSVGPADVYATVARHAPIERAELVGLIPRSVLTAIDPAAWDQLDLAEDRTIEGRLEQRGLVLD
jgi:glutamate formiminotransferase